MRQGTPAGYSMVRRGGSILPMKSRNSTCGYGLTKEFIEERDVRHPYQILQKQPKSSLETIKIKSSKPRKYISLNL